jgi:hypothetical protein
MRHVTDESGQATAIVKPASGGAADPTINLFATEFALVPPGIALTPRRFALIAPRIALFPRRFALIAPKIALFPRRFALIAPKIALFPRRFALIAMGIALFPGTHGLLFTPVGSMRGRRPGGRHIAAGFRAAVTPDIFPAHAIRHR